MLLALDPSVRSPGAALFLTHTTSESELVKAGKVAVRTVVYGHAGARWLEVAKAVLEWCGPYRDHIDEIVFERPQIYRASKSKGDPNDLIGLAGVSMAVVGLLAATNHGPFVIADYSPAEWSGQIPKATKGSAKNSPRAKRILSRLTQSELLCVPDQHDSIDAVGLGLHHRGRLGIRRVYSSGSNQG